MVWLQIINIKLHSKPIWPVLLLSYFTDKETEAQRGGVTCPKPHSRSAGISTQCSLLAWVLASCASVGAGGWAPGPLPMYMELGLDKGLAGRMEFCRASSSLEGLNCSHQSHQSPSCHEISWMCVSFYLPSLLGNILRADHSLLLASLLSLI